MFNIHIFTEQVGSETTVLPFIPEAHFRNPVRKVVAVTISSVTPGTFLGRTSNYAIKSVIYIIPNSLPVLFNAIHSQLLKVFLNK
jgi:hypothetical protein